MSDLDLAAEARRYAGYGWRVLPLYSIRDGSCTCPKREACGNSAGKHPACRRGVRDATAEEDIVRAWWDRSPHANIGIATGEASGVAVVDIDPRNGGDASLQRLEEKYGRLPRTVFSRTGGGGMHILFRHHPAATRSSTERIAPGIDLKSNGGYFVAPPSLHVAGTRYQWDTRAFQFAGALPEFPEWFLRLANSPGSNPIARDGEGIPEGKRNSTLTSYGGMFRRVGLDFGEIDAALQLLNSRRCIPPLHDKEVQHIARSVARYRIDGTPDGLLPVGYDSVHAALLDVLRFAVDLPRPEFLMLLFHVERSLGYGKQSDCTSISQMVDGIRSKKSDTWVRKGCGLQKSAILRANRALAERGMLLSRRRNSSERGKEPTEFEVDWKVLGAFIAELKSNPDDRLQRA